VPGLLILLAFLMAGTLLQHWTSAPIPSAILGMLLLLVFLLFNRKVPPSLAQTTSTLAPLLPLLLMPVSVGIVTHEDLIRTHGITLLAILVISLIPGILVCGWIMSRGK
tara:strand:+ start:485 stop:811 length:327 start_codon:yes stop_codon:yes gene_type:complete